MKDSTLGWMIIGFIAGVMYGVRHAGGPRAFSKFSVPRGVWIGLILLAFIFLRFAISVR